MDESWRVPTQCFPSGIASQWSVDCVRNLRFRCGGNAIRDSHAHAISRANIAPRVGVPFTLVDVADTPVALSAPERWRSSWPYRRLVRLGNR